jgi:23S rRNA (cytidine1920-2'-O)/16S rRNA (cytidine1409-2'-O)-methyltransferase
MSSTSEPGVPGEPRHADDAPLPEAVPFVSRGGVKLDHALRTFNIDVRGVLCADLGCSTGGFTDCLLRAGAAKVYAVDTAYGELAWTLRKDPRVVVMERKNALHVEPPERVGLVVCDLSWTPQRLVIPAARRWLKVGGTIVTLIKPHYEHTDRGGTLPKGGVLDAETAEHVSQETATLIAALGVRVLGLCKSPILGSGGKATGKAASTQAAAGAIGKGNAEWLAWVG